MLTCRGATSGLSDGHSVVEHSRFLLIYEIKRHRARSVLGLGSARKTAGYCPFLCVCTYHVHSAWLICTNLQCWRHPLLIGACKNSGGPGGVPGLRSVRALSFGQRGARSVSPRADPPSGGLLVGFVRRLMCTEVCNCGMPEHPRWAKCRRGCLKPLASIAQLVRA